MAYWIQETSNNHNISNYRLYHCDYLSDISKLPRFGIEGEKQEDDSTASYPCAYGSKCICLENGGSEWVLGKSTNEWHQMNTVGSSGGSSGNDGTDIDVATDEEVDNMLDDVFGNE